MSAFIVQPATINRVVNAAIGAEKTFPLLAPILLGKGALDAAQEIGAALYDMNRRSVLARYPGDDEYAQIPEWRFARKTVADTRESLISHLQAVQCLHYQCSEGDIPKETLFAELEGLSNALALCLAVHYPDSVSQREGWFYDVPEWSSVKAWG